MEHFSSLLLTDNTITLASIPKVGRLITNRLVLLELAYHMVGARLSPTQYLTKRVS